MKYYIFQFQFVNFNFIKSTFTKVVTKEYTSPQVAYANLGG